jgi:hypothetical protein
LALQGESPPFGYSGSRETAVLTDGRWLHISGSTAHGMTGVGYSGEIWQIDLSKDGMHWEKLALQMPSTATDGDNIVVDVKHNKIFIADQKTGVFVGQL